MVPLQGCVWNQKRLPQTYLTSSTVLQLDALNVIDSEEASSHKNDSYVVHVECEEESKNALLYIQGSVQKMKALMNILSLLQQNLCMVAYFH